MNFVGFLVISLGALAINGLEDNKARYDNYRIYSVKIATDEHVKMFQEIEERSDSYTFIGHARHVNQELSIMVASHKIAEITDLLKTKNVEHTILVMKIIAFCIVKSN